MVQYINKDALVAEIESKRKYAQSLGDNAINSSMQQFYDGMKQGCVDTLSFIDTLEEKETEQNLWKPADGEDLPELEREVIVLYQPYPLEGSEYAVGFAHRPDPKGWDGTNIVTGKVEHYTPKTYDKGGWNSPNIKWWLDLELPCGGRTISMNYTDKNKEQTI